MSGPATSPIQESNPPPATRGANRFAALLATVRGKLLMGFLCTTVLTAALGTYAVRSIAEGA